MQDGTIQVDMVEKERRKRLVENERRKRWVNNGERRQSNTTMFLKEKRTNGIADRRAQTTQKTTGCNLEGPFVVQTKEYDLGRTMGFFSFRSHVNALKGRVLTILDASITNLKQHKALKDLFEAEFREELTRVRDRLYKGVVEESTMPSIYDSIYDDEGQGSSD